MITKDLIKTEVDNVPDEYLEVLFRVIKAFESPANSKTLKNNSNVRKSSDNNLGWHEFIQKTYGSLANDPIERGDQGEYEIREEIV